MDVLRDEITRYAQDTRHRAHQYETPEQISQLLRKMLASHMRIVPWSAVYLHVSPGDHQRVVQRSAPLDLGMRVAPPAEFYVQLQQQVERARMPAAEGIYEAFSEHLYPELRKPLYQQEDSAKESRKKALAIFLSQATNANTREVVRNMYPEEKDRAERERVYDAAISYGPLKHEYDTDEAVARELGLFLRTLHFPNVENGQLYIVEPLQTTDVLNDDGAPPYSADRPYAALSPSTVQWSQHNRKDEEHVMRELDQNKSVQNWKTQHALHPQFSSVNAAKQMLMQHYSPQYGALLGASVMGKYQHPEDLLEGEQLAEHVTEADVAHAYKTLISRASEDDLHALMDVPQVHDFVDTLIDDLPRVQLEKLTQQDVLSLFMQNHRDNLTKEFVQKMIEL